MKRKAIIKTAVALLAAAMLLLPATAAAAEIDFTPVAAEGDNTEAVELPSYYSSLDLGYTTSVKRQKYQDCWAYATLATFETYMLKNGIIPGELSINHINVWGSTRTNGKGWVRTYGASGFPSMPVGYLTSWQGAVREDDLKDYAVTLGDPGDSAPTDLARYGVTSVKYLTNSTVREIKRAVYESGAVFTCYAHSARCMSSDGSSFYTPPSYSGSYEGHAISIVGWNDDYPRESFANSTGKLPANNGAWLVKNSWGETSNINGYFWMSYEDKWAFGSKFVPSYAITGAEQINPYKKLIQNEIYGATYEFGYIEEQNLTYLNRLTFDSDYPLIDKVEFESTAKGAAYSLYFVPDTADGTPDADKALWVPLGSGEIGYKGYQCIDIDDFVIPADSGSIAVEIDSSQSGGYATIGVGEWLTSGGNLVFINETERGDSYIFQNGAMTDVMDWYHEENTDDIGGTFVIKAITVKENRPSLLGDADMDGTLTIYDVTEVQRHLAEYVTLEGTALLNADMNCDGIVTIDDATALQRILAGY